MLIVISAINISSACTWAVRTHTREEIGCAGRLPDCSALPFAKKFTIITISHGERLTAAKSTGWFAREQRPHSRDRKGSSAELWAKRLSFSKALRTKKPNTLSTARFMAPAESWGGWRPEAKRTAKRGRYFVQAK